VALQQLLAVQTLVESLLKSEFSVRLLSSGFGYSGFESLLAGMVTLLVISVADCPTIEQLEQLVAKKEKEENLPEGTVRPASFAGANASATDEWLFISEIKAPELSFSKVATLRLVAKPTDHIFVGRHHRENEPHAHQDGTRPGRRFEARRASALYIAKPAIAKPRIN
jgi:hypothetical protein